MKSEMANKTVSVQGTDAEQEVLFWFRQNKVNLENMIGKKLSSMSLSWTIDGGIQLQYTEIVPDHAPVTE